MADAPKTLLIATWITAGAWLLYGFMAILASDEGPTLEPATNLPLAAMQVALVDHGVRTPCGTSAEQGRSTAREKPDKPAPRRMCTKHPWQWAGPFVDRFNGRAQRCIWAHPPHAPQHLELTWTAVALGDAVTVTVSLLERAGAGRPVNVRLFVDGQLLVRGSVSDPRAPAELSVAVAPGRARADVRIEIDAPDNSWRLACVRLMMHGQRQLKGGRDAAVRAPDDRQRHRERSSRRVR